MINTKLIVYFFMLGGVWGGSVGWRESLALSGPDSYCFDLYDRIGHLEGLSLFLVFSAFSYVEFC